MTVNATVKQRPHPAKYTKSVLAEIDRRVFPLLEHQDRVLDPFAGVGGIHQLGYRYRTVGVEIEPEWSRQHPQTVVGNALALPFPDESFDAVITSPSYGNRLADKYDGRDGSRRHTYRIDLGRMPSKDSSAVMAWGDEYREFHRKAWTEAVRVTRKLVVVNISNHIRGGKEMKVAEWHLSALVDAGLRLYGIYPVQTPRMRHGSNHKARVDVEHVLVMRK